MKKILVLPVIAMMTFTVVGCKKESAPEAPAITGVGDVQVAQDGSPSEVLGNLPLATDEEFLVDSDQIKMDAKGVLLEQAPVVTLVDVAGGNASGQSRVAYADGVTYHTVLASGMPELTNGDFYEGWLVKNAALGQFFSTGKMIKNPNGEFFLDYEHDGDVTDHTKIVITLEPDDGDPAPAAHIIEN